MKYIVTYIPTGKFLIHTGYNKKSEKNMTLFSALGIVKPLDDGAIRQFRHRRQKEFRVKGIKGADKYASYTDDQIRELFVRKPTKFSSYEEALTALRETESFVGIQIKTFRLTEENECLFDIIEVDA